ncbi:hypothetical protein ACFYYS_00530 [Streptomyces sp. NPDC002120]|uniref:hypothetical protein n=1 Tax=Streptomyces sp. NPDC002120 TaxID=3364631 RepID=UPI0036889485
MAVHKLGKDPESKTGDSPTVYLDDETDNYLVQGWKVDDGRRSAMNLPENEDVIEIPRRMVQFFMKEDRGDA